MLMKYFFEDSVAKEKILKAKKDAEKLFIYLNED